MKQLKAFFELIKFEHTIFALPFAYLGMVMAARGWPGWRVFFLVTLAMAFARTAGMTLNRLIDQNIDAKNPRTKSRSLVTGEFKPLWAWLCVVVSVAVLLLTAAALNPLCLKLSPIALLFLTGYHYAKRFTEYCHWILGAVLGIAPMGGWIAVTGHFDWQPLILAFAVLFWVAGFDILYSLQDVDFDRSAGLHSIPVKYGVQTSLRIAAFSHAATILFLALFAFFGGLGIVYIAGVILIAILFRIEHGLVSDGDLSRLNTAFFTINGWVGILIFVFTALDIYR